MIAAVNLLYSHFAFGTIAHIITESPLLQIPFLCLFTFHVAMPFNATVKTHFKTTLALHSPAFTFFYIVVAVRSKAPLQIRVQVNINVFLKP
jgi:hypothetical protein